MGQPDSARRQVGGLEPSTKAMAAFQAPFAPSPSRASLSCRSKSRMICRASAPASRDYLIHGFSAGFLDACIKSRRRAATPILPRPTSYMIP